MDPTVVLILVGVARDTGEIKNLFKVHPTVSLNVETGSEALEVNLG